MLLDMITINLVAPVYFIATKLEAFNGRGNLVVLRPSAPTYILRPLCGKVINNKITRKILSKRH